MFNTPRNREEQQKEERQAQPEEMTPEEAARIKPAFHEMPNSRHPR